MKYFLEKQNPNDDFAEVVAVNFKNGDIKTTGDILVVLETAKAAIEITAVDDGPVYTTIEIGDTVAVGETIAFQNEAPEPAPPNPVEKTNTFSQKAIRLIESKNLDRAIFNHLNLVRESDVLEYLSDEDNSSRNAAEPAITKNFKAINSTLDNYVEPPVAYFSFTLDRSANQELGDEKEYFWKKVVANLCSLFNSETAHLLVNYDEKLTPFELDMSAECVDLAISKASMEVYRGKKTSLKVLLPLSYLKADFLFEHTPLLYPGSSATIAVAETNNGTLKCNICYDHRIMDGYRILKSLEEIL